MWSQDEKTALIAAILLTMTNGPTSSRDAAREAQKLLREAERSRVEVAHSGSRSEG